jgi:hypothetical protein
MRRVFAGEHDGVFRPMLPAETQVTGHRRHHLCFGIGGGCPRTAQRVKQLAVRFYGKIQQKRLAILEMVVRRRACDPNLPRDLP